MVPSWQILLDIPISYRGRGKAHRFWKWTFGTLRWQHGKQITPFTAHMEGPTQPSAGASPWSCGIHGARHFTRRAAVLGHMQVTEDRGCAFLRGSRGHLSSLGNYL
jgi:hypothetical protein